MCIRCWNETPKRCLASLERLWNGQDCGRGQSKKRRQFEDMVLGLYFWQIPQLLSWTIKTESFFCVSHEMHSHSISTQTWCENSRPNFCHYFGKQHHITTIPPRNDSCGFFIWNGGIKPILSSAGLKYHLEEGSSSYFFLILHHNDKIGNGIHNQQFMVAANGSRWLLDPKPKAFMAQHGLQGRGKLPAKGQRHENHLVEGSGNVVTILDMFFCVPSRPGTTERGKMRGKTLQTKKNWMYFSVEIGCIWPETTCFLAKWFRLEWLCWKYLGYSTLKRNRMFWLIANPGDAAILICCLLNQLHLIDLCGFSWCFFETMAGSWRQLIRISIYSQTKMKRF